MRAFIFNSSGEKLSGEKLFKCKCTEVTHNIIINVLGCKSRFVRGKEHYVKSGLTYNTLVKKAVTLATRLDSYPHQKWSAPSILSHSFGSGRFWQNSRNWSVGIRLSLLPEIRSFGLGQLLRKSKSNIGSGGEIAARALIRLSLKPTGKAKPAPAE